MHAARRWHFEQIALARAMVSRSSLKNRWVRVPLPSRQRAVAQSTSVSVTSVSSNSALVQLEGIDDLDGVHVGCPWGGGGSRCCGRELRRKTRKAAGMGSRRPVALLMWSHIRCGRNRRGERLWRDCDGSATSRVPAPVPSPRTRRPRCGRTGALQRPRWPGSGRTSCRSSVAFRVVGRGPLERAGFKGSTELPVRQAYFRNRTPPFVPASGPMTLRPTPDDIERARERTSPYLRVTPLIEHAGATLKLELLQHAGSFKPRGGVQPRAVRAVAPFVRARRRERWEPRRRRRVRGSHARGHRRGVRALRRAPNSSGATSNASVRASR